MSDFSSNITPEVLEKLYQEIGQGVFEPHVLVMSWPEFKCRYGADGEFLNDRYIVVDVEGCAQVMRK